jgi:predicted dienelactone hydrolase
MKHYSLLLLLLLLSLALPSAAQDKSPDAPGPYRVDMQMFDWEDERRDNRAIQTYVYYPAERVAGAQHPYPPDASGAPYPLIIYSHSYGGIATESRIILNWLAAHGFVVATIEHVDPHDAALPLLDRPLDVLFVLNQLAGLQNHPLAGVVDTDNVGVMGTSFGGYTSLVVGGARIDGDYFKNWCATAGLEVLPNYCGWLLPGWSRTTDYYDQLFPPSTDNLWAAITDERIRAIFPMVPCFGQMFGEAGLESVSIPAFIIGGSADETCPYDLDAAYYYEHLNGADHYLATMNGRDHSSALDNRMIEYYATAFFGFYLQGKTDYTDYLTPESAENFRDATLQSEITQ